MNWFELTMSIVFWMCFGLVAYTYLAYPALIWLASRLFGRESSPAEVIPAKLPAVSLLIAAYNEEGVIEERLQNALALDYPRDRLEIVVGSDGSDDGTNAIVRRYASQGVVLFDYSERRGKSAVLNSSVPRLNGDIVVFSDANTMYDSQAIRRLVRRFEDPKVGAVCGRLILTDPATGQNVDSLYWQYETFLKRCESRVETLLGANGAIYALPKKLYVPIPDNTIIDDFVIPLLSKLRHGFRVDYEPTALLSRKRRPRFRPSFAGVPALGRAAIKAWRRSGGCFRRGTAGRGSAFFRTRF